MTEREEFTVFIMRTETDDSDGATLMDSIYYVLGDVLPCVSLLNQLRNPRSWYFSCSDSPAVSTVDFEVFLLVFH